MNHQVTILISESNQVFKEQIADYFKQNQIINPAVFFDNNSDLLNYLFECKNFHKPCLVMISYASLTDNKQNEIILKIKQFKLIPLVILHPVDLMIEEDPHLNYLPLPINNDSFCHAMRKTGLNISLIQQA